MEKELLMFINQLLNNNKIRNNSNIKEIIKKY